MHDGPISPWFMMSHRTCTVILVYVWLIMYELIMTTKKMNEWFHHLDWNEKANNFSTNPGPFLWSSKLAFAGLAAYLTEHWSQTSAPCFFFVVRKLQKRSLRNIHATYFRSRSISPPLDHTGIPKHAARWCEMMILCLVFSTHEHCNGYFFSKANMHFFVPPASNKSSKEMYITKILARERPSFSDRKLCGLMRANRHGSSPGDVVDANSEPSMARMFVEVIHCKL